MIRSRRTSLSYIAKLLLAASLLSYAPATRAASSSYDYQVFAKSGDVIGGVTLDSVGTAFLLTTGASYLLAGTIPAAKLCFSNARRQPEGRCLFAGRFD